MAVLKQESPFRFQPGADQLLADHFRCIDNLADIVVSEQLSAGSGYFRCGPNSLCYGQCSSGDPASVATGALHDAGPHVKTDWASIQLPFDPAQIVNNLLYERYRPNPEQGRREINAHGIVRSLYYLVRPLMPITIRKHLQRLYFRDWREIPFPRWPVDFGVEDIFEQLLILSMKSRNIKRLPFIWFWPEGASSCAVVTHDVETAYGRDYCPALMDLNDSFGIKSAFQVVPENRYSVPQSLLDTIRDRGFELNVHDLNHDGHLMERKEEFLRRAKQINRYGKEFGARGFRSAMLHRNLDWSDALDFSYDMSVPNVAHLDPQRGGCCTVFPFFNGKLLELPVTMIQDYTLFHILEDYSISIWKQQIEMITQRHGLMNFIIHPDYITKPRERGVYESLLEHLSCLRQERAVWITTPGEVNHWWRQRAELRLVEDSQGWRIEGTGQERARIAYAREEGGLLVFECEEPSMPDTSFASPLPTGTRRV
jgi:hypothetical protein